MRKRVPILLFVLLFLSPVVARAFERFADYDSTSSPTWPVMYVDYCRDTFDAEFPGFNQDNIFTQFNAGLAEWFTGGGADFRLRFGSYVSTDDCVKNRPPGRIHARAERAHGGMPCQPNIVGAGFPSCYNCTADGGYFAIIRGYYDMVPDPSDPTKEICSAYLPPAQQVFIPNGWDTDARRHIGGIDFQRWFIHEVGHVIGFSHEFDPPENTFTMMSYNSTDNLSVDDATGLRKATNSIDLWAQTYEVGVDSAGKLSVSSWGKLSAATHLSHLEIGAASNYSPTWPDETLVALYADAKTTEIFRLENASSTPDLAAGRSFRAPAFAASFDPPIESMAIQLDDFTHQIQTYWTTDGIKWQPGTLLDGIQTTIPPSMGYLPEHKIFVLAYARAVGSRIGIALSDDGINYNHVAWLNSRTSDSFGLDCARNGSNRCLIVHGDSTIAGDPLRVVELGITSATSAPSVLSDEELLDPNKAPIYNYGVDVAYVPNSTKYVVATRDRGRATVLRVATFSLGTPAVALDAQYFEMIHSAPRLAVVKGKIYLATSAHSRYDK